MPFKRESKRVLTFFSCSSAFRKHTVSGNRFLFLSETVNKTCPLFLFTRLQTQDTYFSLTWTIQRAALFLKTDKALLILKTCETHLNISYHHILYQIPSWFSIFVEPIESKSRSVLDGFGCTQNHKDTKYNRKKVIRIQTLVGHQEHILQNFSNLQTVENETETERTKSHLVSRRSNIWTCLVKST